MLELEDIDFKGKSAESVGVLNLEAVEWVRLGTDSVHWGSQRQKR